MILNQKQLELIESDKDSEAESGIKLVAMGEVADYVNQHKDVRMCPVLNNPLMTLPRTTMTTFGSFLLNEVL